MTLTAKCPGCALPATVVGGVVRCAPCERATQRFLAASQMRPSELQFRNDHTNECTCGKCVMHRLRGEKVRERVTADDLHAQIIAAGGEWLR